ncbi:MAG: MerR family transcriptional regulator, partial [Paludibacteraceae bacterium]|nr:MerR family transcriptional regulator [Paludibacteraceae bacterium]
MSKAKAYHLIEDFPNKLYYTIAEVADDVGVEQSALRFWENEFDVLKPKRDPRGKRQYTKKDVLTVRQIYDLVKIEGLSLEGAKAKIKNKKGEVERNSELRAKLLSLKEQIKALSSLLTLPSEVEAEEEESEKIQLVGYPTVTIEEYKPVMFDPTPEKEEETATAEPVDETPAEPTTVEPSEPEAEVEPEEIKAEPAAEAIVEEAKEEAP